MATSYKAPTTKEIDMKIYAHYSRLSEEEHRKNKTDPEGFDRVQKKMAHMLSKLASMKIPYYGPELEKIKDMSIPNQMQIGLQWFKDNKVKAEGFYVDYDVSGALHDREQFNKIRQKAHKGTIDGVLIKDQQRFARDVAFEKIVRAEFKNWKKDIKFIYGQEISDNPIGSTMIAAINETRVHEGRKYHDERVEQCIKDKIPFTTPPFGYKSNKDKDQWIIHKKNIKIVYSVLIDYTSGVKYMDTLEKLGISKSKYYRILKNIRMYAGKIRYKETIKDALTKKVLRKEWREYQGSHDKLISWPSLLRLEKIIEKGKK